MATKSLSRLERLYVAYYVLNIVLTRKPRGEPAYRTTTPSSSERMKELRELVAVIADIQGDYDGAAGARRANEFSD